MCERMLEANLEGRQLPRPFLKSAWDVITGSYNLLLILMENAIGMVRAQGKLLLLHDGRLHGVKPTALIQPLPKIARLVHVGNGWAPTYINSIN